MCTETEDVVISWLKGVLQPEYEVGAYSCLHVGAAMVAAFVLECPDCGAAMLDADGMKRWLKRELVFAGGRMDVRRYDKDGKLVSVHRLEGVHLKDEPTLPINGSDG